MSKKIQLLLPIPCHEQWQAMTPTTKGRFCKSCYKEVIDFTLMTDQQILGFISNSGNSICGRLAPDQLNRDLIERRERKRGWLAYAIQLVLPTLLIASRVTAQSSPKPGPIATSYQHFSKKIGKVPIGNGNLERSEGKLIEPEIIVDPKLPVNPASTMPMLVCYAGGISICRRSTSVFSKLKDSLAIIVKTDSIKVYPNPVIKGQHITIEFNLKNPGNQLIEVFNLSGQKLVQKNIESGSTKFCDYLSSDFAFETGVYFVVVTNMSSKKQITRKLVVQ